MSDILFRDNEHSAFYREHLESGVDPYFRALVYLFGLTAETRENFPQCFDQDTRMIKPEALNDGWQTGGTGRADGVQPLEWMVLRDRGGCARRPDFGCLYARQPVLL